MGIEPVGTAKRYQKARGGRVDIPRPLIVQVYNKHMGGVDLADMIVSLHPINIRSKKWYRRVIWRVFDLQTSNTRLLYRKDNGYSTTLFDFKFHLSLTLLSGARPDRAEIVLSDDEIECSIAKKKRDYVNAIPVKARYDKHGHFTVHGDKRKRCRLPIIGDQRWAACGKNTMWKCSKCGVYLCLNSEGNCFVDYHNK